MPLTQKVKGHFFAPAVRITLASPPRRWRLKQTFTLREKEGFDLFPGYSFNKPLVLARPALGSILNRFDPLSELQHPSLRLARILKLLKQKTAVSYRLKGLPTLRLLARVKQSKVSNERW